MLAEVVRSDRRLPLPVQERSLEERVYPSRRFDVLGLVQQRRRGGPGGQRDSGAPGLGIYSAWLGGLPGFLSGAHLLVW